MEAESEREIGCCYAAGIKIEDGVVSQSTQAAARSWKRQGNASSPEPPDGKQHF